jgi:hypothetical protein
MLGKFAAIIGPLLMGATGLAVKHLLLPDAPTPDQFHAVGVTATRTGIVSVLLLFIAGAILFSFVDEAKGKAELEALSGRPEPPRARRRPGGSRNPESFRG